MQSDHLGIERLPNQPRRLRRILGVDAEPTPERRVRHPASRHEAQTGVLVAGSDAVLRVHLRQLSWSEQRRLREAGLSGRDRHEVRCRK